MIRQFVASDFEEIQHWYKVRDSLSSTQDLLPKFGLIVPGIACGFLIKTDCAYAILDNFISNPDCDSEVRGQAISDIGNALELEAAKSGFSFTILLTDLKAVSQRAHNHGYQDLGRQFSFMSKRI